MECACVAVQTKPGIATLKWGTSATGWATEGPAIDSSNRKTLQLMVIAESEGETGVRVGWTAPKGHFYLNGSVGDGSPKTTTKPPQKQLPAADPPSEHIPAAVEPGDKADPRRGPAPGARSPEQSNRRRNRSPPRARDNSRQRQPQQERPGRKSRAT